MRWEYGRVIRAEIDFANDGNFVDVSRYLKKTNIERHLFTDGRDTLDSATITLHSKHRIFDPFFFQDTYDPSAEKFNGPRQEDGYGNLRKGRAVRIYVDIVNTPKGDISSLIFSGKIDKIDYDPREKETTFTLKDNGLALMEAEAEKGGWVRKWVSKRDASNNDLVHLICEKAGVEVDTIDLPFIAPVFELKEDETYWSALSRVAESVCGFMHMDEAGRLLFRSYLSDDDYDFDGEIDLKPDMLLTKPEITYTEPIGKIEIKGIKYHMKNYDMLIFRAGEQIPLPKDGFAPGGIKTEETKNSGSYVLEYEANRLISVYVDRIPSSTGEDLENVRVDDAAVLESDGYTVTFQEPYVNYSWWGDATKKITYELKEPRLQYFRVQYDVPYAEVTKIHLIFDDTNYADPHEYELSPDEMDSQDFVDYWEVYPAGIKARFKNIWGKDMLITTFEVYGYPIEKAGNLRLYRLNRWMNLGDTLKIDNDLINTEAQAKAVIDYLSWKFKPKQQVKLKTWMIPWVLPGVLINLDLSEELQGTYQVMEIVHEGIGGQQPTTELVLEKFDAPNIEFGANDVNFFSKTPPLRPANYNVLWTFRGKDAILLGEGMYKVQVTDSDYLEQDEDGNWHVTFEDEIDAGIIKYRVLSGTNIGNMGKVIGYESGSAAYIILRGVGFDDTADVEVLAYKVSAASLKGDIDLAKNKIKSDKVQIGDDMVSVSEKYKIDTEGFKAGNDYRWDESGIQAGTDVKLDTSGVAAGSNKLDTNGLTLGGELMMSHSAIAVVWKDAYMRDNACETINWILDLDDLVTCKSARLKATVPNNATVKYGSTVLGGSGTYNLSIDPDNVEDVIVEFSNTTENFTGDGSQKVFQLSHHPVGNVTVKIDGTEVFEYDVDHDDGKIIFEEAPADNASIEVTYTPCGRVRLELQVKGIFSWG